MFIVAIIGAATALFAATIGLAQNDIKKVLAYSTISQLGYMFLACGVGAFTGGDFSRHHARVLQSAALPRFGLGDSRHASRAGHAAHGRAEEIHADYICDDVTGWLAISRHTNLRRASSRKTKFSGGPGAPEHSACRVRLGARLLWFIGALTALLTAVYMTRMMVMTFWGTERFREKHLDHVDGAQGVHDDAHHFRSRSSRTA